MTNIASCTCAPAAYKNSAAGGTTPLRFALCTLRPALMTHHPGCPWSMTALYLRYLHSFPYFLFHLAQISFVRPVGMTNIPRKPCLHPRACIQRKSEHLKLLACVQTLLHGTASPFIRSLAGPEEAECGSRSIPRGEQEREFWTRLPSTASFEPAAPAHRN